MPFIPHTDEDVKDMLSELNLSTTEALFSEIPEDLKINELPGIPEALSEMQVKRLMQDRAKKDKIALNFIGAGAYEHHIPAAVWDLVSRGEFMTAYTPYQAEASQGTLQVLYEFQTMMASLMGMPVSNASMYEGGTALAEAILMAVRCQKKVKYKRILLPKTVHPFSRQVVKTIVELQDIEVVEVPFDIKTGRTTVQSLEQNLGEGACAVVLPQPNFFGVLEEVDELASWAEQNRLFTIGYVNPMAMALLKPPGEWGQKGFDIACGEAQPFGVPVASGGPYVGFLCCQKAHVRQLPGRLVGMTQDESGRRGFTLTLQAREQHIRRSKATSNICTNQGLLATCATIYMSLMGQEGLHQVAKQCHMQSQKLRKALQGCESIQLAFEGAQSPCFHESVIQFKVPVDKIIAQLAEMGIQAGFDLSNHYPELGQSLLCCVTETKTEEDLQIFVEALKKVA